MDAGACNYDDTATIDAGCEYETCAGCMDPIACDYDPSATIQAYGEFEGEIGLSFSWTPGSWDSEVSWHIGYDGGAYSGVAGSEPTLYIAAGTFTICGYDSSGDGWNGGELVITDNASGNSVSLAVEGDQTCVEITVTGPPALCEYESCAGCDGIPNSGLVIDECGVCDGNNSTCLDECGVPNGDNSSCTDECGVPNGDNTTCAGCDGIPNSGLVIDECGVCDGNNSTCLDECGVPNGDNSSCTDECGVPNGDNTTCAGCDGIPNYTINHDGYDYPTIQIGDQCWFSENCRYLPSVSPSSANSSTSPYYYVYGYEGTDVAAAQATDNYATYGVLYNWPAVMTEGICPSGWHIPSDGEWQTMEVSLGMSIADASSIGWRGTDEGYQMKSTSGWNSGGNGSNSSGFNGLPGGYRYYGGFVSIGNYGNWWSASESGSSSWGRALGYDFVNVLRGIVNQYDGFYARCVRDYTDDCGVLNGDNSTCSDDCGVPNGDNSTCLDECGVPNGDNSTCFISCGNDIEHEGYDYSTVQIGEQCWFSENSRYLPAVSDSYTGSETVPHYYVHGYEGSNVSDAVLHPNYSTYGVLYNHASAMVGDVCPSGWVVPSKDDFDELSDFLGGITVAGEHLKSQSGWTSNGNGTNSSGFTGVPGGYRTEYGGVFALEFKGLWWSATISVTDPDRAHLRDLDYFWNNFQPQVYRFGNGYSVRCLMNTSSISGCTDPAACNFDSSANADDGTCFVPGDVCDDGDSNTIDDEVQADCSCAGTPFGCIDPVACNFDSYATIDDGTCVIPGEVCDDGDPNTLDDEVQSDCSCAGTPAVSFFCGALVNHEGYNYSTVQIGGQCWFAENCRYLPSVSETSYVSDIDPYYYVYDYEGTDVAVAMATSNYDTYGVLYNWSAFMEPGLCPSGWHMPSDEEWQVLEMELGMTEAEADIVSWRGDPVGTYLKSTTGWYIDNGTNSSGFTAMPGGNSSPGGFWNHEVYGDWWSTTENGSYSWGRRMHYYNGDINRNYFDLELGMSARCLQAYDITQILGCIDSSACNFDPIANTDNATCVLPGDPCDDGDPITTDDEVQADCSCVGTPNVTLILGCIDPAACNFDSSADTDDSTCILPGDSCDDGDSNTADDEVQADCSCVGTPSILGDCGVITHEGYDYATVQIGNQCWFAENCRYLPSISNSNDLSETAPYYYVYGFEGTAIPAAIATSNYATYGVLYNWPAVMAPGICPSGWHIPSDDDFTQLTDLLGGVGLAGGKMKEAGYDHWSSPNEGATNSSGWTGLPGGEHSSIYFNGIVAQGYWWSTSQSGSNSWYRNLTHWSDNVQRDDISRSVAFSARCVQD